MVLGRNHCPGKIFNVMWCTESAEDAILKASTGGTVRQTTPQPYRRWDDNVSVKDCRSPSALALGVVTYMNYPLIY